MPNVSLALITHSYHSLNPQLTLKTHNSRALALKHRYNVSGSGSSSTSNGNGCLSGSRVKKFSLGDYHTCAINVDGELKCWGSDVQGQLGNDPHSILNRDLKPGVSVDLGEGRTAVAVAAGGGFTCAVRSVLMKSRMLEKMSIIPLTLSYYPLKMMNTHTHNFSADT